MLSLEHKNQINNAVLSLGYTDEMIRKDFSFLGRNGKSTADMVIFGSTRHFDLETACLGINYAQNNNFKILDDFKMLAIPYGILAHECKVEIWPIGTEGPKRQQKQDCSYEELSNYFTKNRIHFSPTSILKAKEQGRQLSFADLDMGSLCEWGFNANKQKLKFNIEAAIENAKLKLPAKYFDKLTQITIRLLAASILHDKGYVKTSIDYSASDLLKSARDLYPKYFSVEDIKVLEENIIEKILEDIRSGGCVFTNLTTEMLDHLYQYAFVNEESRKELGIYATPRKIAKMMANNLPVEDIRLDNLYLLDGTCGSGSLLVAGHRRMYDLLPVYKTEAEKHGFLSNHIFGVDKDPFAAEIAGLSLLHESLPSGNSWKIFKGDFTKTEIDVRPSLILANPPYRELRSESHIEKAIPFVEKNLDLLVEHGLMAIILPETFLQKSSCKDIRKRILNECEILEIWQLPEGIFEVSSSATTILFLRKNLTKPKSFPVRVQRILNDDKIEFINRGHTSFSYLFPNQDDWNSEHSDFEIIPNIFQRLWAKLSNFKKLGEVAEIRNGITPGPGREDHFCHDDPPNNWKKWLNGPSAIHPFLIDWENQRKSSYRPFGNRYVNWPGNLHRPISELKAIFEAKNEKIIINARRNPNTRWRITAAIDDTGYFPSYDLHIIFNIEKKSSIEELTVVLNHSIITAWIDDHIRAKYFHKKLLAKIPIPDFSVQQKRDLKKLVRELMQKPIQTEFDNILKKIDNIVDQAFELTDEEKVLLKQAGFFRENIDRKRDLKTIFPDRTWIITGIVEGIDIKNNKIKVWFRGFGDEAIEINVPEKMPGWALRSDLAFEAEIPFEDRYKPDWSKLHNFSPVRYSYMSEEELLQRIAARG